MNQALHEQIRETVRAELEGILVRERLREQQDQPALQIFLVKTPAGGIDAAVGDTPGSAVCTLAYVDDDGVNQTTTHTETVLNIFTSGAVAGSAWIIVVQEAGSGKYLAASEDC